jgi:SAM-dependent methyltransferase
MAHRPAPPSGFASPPKRHGWGAEGAQSVNLPTFETLLTPLGQSAIAAAAELNPTEESFLPCLTRLQKQYPSALAKAALETVLLRARARSKFSRAEAMYFTREALEQASGEVIARYRAERYAGFASAADLGCGLGGDSIGLAGHCTVAAVDLDPLRLAMAAQNLAAYGYRERVTLIQDDVTRMHLPLVDAFFFDPARRSGGRRKFSVRNYQPPLAIVREWFPHTPAIGVKISPGVDLAELADYGGEIEFISQDGELKECALWFGPLKTASRRATLLPARHSLTGSGAAVRVSAPLAYLYEPDPAILRAGLVTTLAAQLDAHQLDADIAYLTSDTVKPTPFARAFVIEASFPFQLKRLRERLRALRVGQVTVKKRGSPLVPEDLIHKLKVSGPESRVVFLTHVRGEPYVLIGQTLKTREATSAA